MALSINQLALSQADFEHTFLQCAFPFRGAAFRVETREDGKGSKGYICRIRSVGYVRSITY